MKSIYVTFEDSEFEQLDNVKGDLTWREFILQFIEPKKVNKWNKKQEIY